MTICYVNYDKVPVPHMAPAIRRYVERGIAPGHFLIALLSNDLMGAIGRADEDNQDAIVAWARFVYCELPNGCHGSPEHVSDWIKGGGLNGIDVEPQQAEEES